MSNLFSNLLRVGVLVIGAGVLAGAVYTVHQRDTIVPPAPAPVVVTPRVSTAPPSTPAVPGLDGQNPVSLLTFAVIGDSFAGAKGADDVSEGWVARVIEQMCWAPGSESVEGGTGYTTAGPIPNQRQFSDRIGDAIAVKPQVVFVQGGTNDEEATTQQITDAAGQVFRSLRDGLPGAAIVAIGPSWAPKKDAANMQRISAAIAAAAGTYGIVFMDPTGEHWLSDAAQFDPDGYHPNSDGYAEYSRRLIQDLGRLGVNSRCVARPHS